MAGDWIKVEHATPDKPEVLMLADLLGIQKETAVGYLFNFWIWIDRNLRNANGVTNVTHMSRKSLDSAMNCVGFAAALAQVGWVEIDDSTGVLTIPNVGRHNTNSAKTRALSKDRQDKYRNATVTLPSRSRNANSVTREEKRREEVKSSTCTEYATTPVDNSVKSKADLKNLQVKVKGMPERPHMTQAEQVAAAKALAAKERGGG